MLNNSRIKKIQANAGTVPQHKQIKTASLSFKILIRNHPNTGQCIMQEVETGSLNTARIYQSIADNYAHSEARGFTNTRSNS
jgi:hypothetical protein